MDFLVKSIQQIDMKSKAAVQLQILQSMEVKVVEHHLKNIPFVQNNRVHNILRAGFCPVYGGVNFIPCPSESGKSTHVHKYVNEFVMSWGNLRLFESELKPADDF